MQIQLKELKRLFSAEISIDSIDEEVRGDRATIYFFDEEDNMLDSEEREKTTYITLQQAGKHSDWNVSIQMDDEITVDEDDNSSFEFEKDEEKYFFSFYSETSTNIF